MMLSKLSPMETHCPRTLGSLRHQLHLQQMRLGWISWSKYTSHLAIVQEQVIFNTVSTTRNIGAANKR